MKNNIMEKKINIEEILKNCPKGMELDCIMYDSVQFNSILEGSTYPIKIQTPDGQISLDKYGCCYNHKHAKCIIFPKGKTTWDGFQRPFKDGDIIATKRGEIAIFKRIHPLFENEYIDFYFGVAANGLLILKNTVYQNWGKISEIHLATEEEKQKLFDVIKVNGYKWNPETKTLKKLIEPKFKVGDVIKSKCSQIKYTVTDIIRDNVYIIRNSNDKFGYHISFKEENNYELVPNKFDITTLKPFESRVLVRDASCYNWEPDIFGRYSDGYITLGGAKWNQCIPYEGNEHLLGTTNDCDEFYKNW